MIPPGWYHVLIHGIKTNGEHASLDCTIIDTGERVRLKLWPRQLGLVMIATMHQPTGVKNGQVLLDVILHPLYGNSIRKIEGVPKDQLIPVQSDVEVDRPTPTASFE